MKSTVYNAATHTSLPVQVAKIQTKVATASTPIIAPVSVRSSVNTQVSNIAPDTSGKTMTQFETMVGTASGQYSTLAEAQRACIEEAQAMGFSNYIEVPTSGAYRLLAW